MISFTGASLRKYELGRFNSTKTTLQQQLSISTLKCCNFKQNLINLAADLLDKEFAKGL